MMLDDRKQYATVSKLKIAIQEAWNKIPLSQLIKKLTKTMSKLINLLIKGSIKQIKY